ncbi:MAG: ABC transporter substrate-binding protein [Pyrinomonadaceae bacterium]
MDRNRTFSMLICTLLLLTAACSRTSTEQKPSVERREVRDDLGRPVKVPARIERAVSLAPNLTENVFAVGAGDRLVGVTTFCDYPEEARSIRKIGDTMNPNLEAIIALKPDVVLVSTASQIETFSRTLADNGIAVYVTDPNSLEGVMQNLRQLGELFGTSDKAEILASDLQTRVDAVFNKTGGRAPVRVFVQISNEPLFTIGKQSFLTDFLRKAGAESVTAGVEMGYPKLSKETAAALNPDVIILSESPDNTEPNTVFRNSPAVKSGRVTRINADLLSRPGPRLVDALEQISEKLHQ